MKILTAIMLVPALSIQEAPPPPKTAPVTLTQAEYETLLRVMDNMQQINAQAIERAERMERQYQTCMAGRWI